MSNLSPLDLFELLAEALRSERGIAVTTSDASRLRQRLYKARKEDPAFANLSFNTSPNYPETELWIMKKS